MNSNNSKETNYYIYLIPIILLILGLGFLFFYRTQNFSIQSTSSPTGPSPTGTSPTGPSPTGTSPTGPSPTGTSPTGPSPTGPSPVIENIEQRKLQYKKNIINSINKHNGIVVKENFIYFNNIIDMSDDSMKDYDCIGSYPEKGKINDISNVPCSKVFNPFFEGNFNLKCNSDKKWEITDYNCKTKGLTDKKDLTGKWKMLRLTDDEISGNVPINYERDLTDEEKQNERNYTIFKSFDMNTEKGKIYGDGRDIDYEYIKDVGYTVGNLFPIGMTFVDNKYDTIVGSKFFMKKI